ncbi:MULTISPECIES: methionyl-tRNA formyltransferase [Candidatus Ichthyocystis]|uniref:methionyl-tRNA formyltransferase n=1 Tax=Candidatus Ichthyocystis TaxID=2929841 RepID=UPI000A65632F|nr:MULTISPECIES: methionyl-tRNA formyltransferase [Ichthyocystis]
MNIVFAGTPDFGAATLKAILCDYKVSAVVTMPDRPAGRGMKERMSPVKEIALLNTIPVLQPEALGDPEFMEALKSYSPDIIVVSAYGSFFPKSVLCLPPLGCINVHASLLPKHRGASPIAQAILQGDSIAGVSIISMTSVLDAGPVLVSLSTPLSPKMEVSALHNVLSCLGGKAVRIALQRIEKGVVCSHEQCGTEATYAPKLGRRCTIDWSKSASELDRFVRALGNFPGVYSTYNNKLIKIISLEPVTDIVRSIYGLPGAILSIHKTGIVVSCGDGCVRLLKLQKPGGKRLSAFEFSLGSGLAVGGVLGLGSVV